MSTRFPHAEAIMRAALEWAARGIGRVEPNPPVGAVIVDADNQLLGGGFHQQFGGPHAEIHALREAGDRAAGATMYVTLEPCCHHGKTPPCTDAIIQAGIGRVVVAVSDPAPHVAGGGLRALRAAGIPVEVGLLKEPAARLIAPFVKLTCQKLPFVHGKWAMTLDGKIASRDGHSQWISNPASRRIVHELRGRMDAILVGAGTARADDPRLTARPKGPRAPTRIVVDRLADLPLTSQLVQTLAEAPVMVAATQDADPAHVARLEQAGVEVLRLPADNSSRVDLGALLAELGRRRFTHVLVEGGGELLGACFDGSFLDEIHVFIAPKLVGGAKAVSPLAGQGLSQIPQGSTLEELEIQTLDGDVYVHGRLAHPSDSAQD